MMVPSTVDTSGGHGLPVHLWLGQAVPINNLGESNETVKIS
jgi:hypothetical protein